MVRGTSLKLSALTNLKLSPRWKGTGITYSPIKAMPKGPKGENRPADVIGAAVKVMRIATGEEEEDHAPIASAARAGEAMTPIETPLEMCRRHVAEGKGRIERQLCLIDRAVGGGNTRLVDAAEQFLILQYELQRAAEAHAACLEKIRLQNSN
jgi:hypothetical protein